MIGMHAALVLLLMSEGKHFSGLMSSCAIMACAHGMCVLLARQLAGGSATSKYPPIDVP